MMSKKDHKLSELTKVSNTIKEAAIDGTRLCESLVKLFSTVPKTKSPRRLDNLTDMIILFTKQSVKDAQTIKSNIKLYNKLLNAIREGGKR